ncbi:flap endonuclease-1 [Candidatus Undinarchaeota archaeon]
MGVQLSNIVQPEKITFEELAGRLIGIDAFNTLYQFLSIIRQRDGTPLMDSKRRVTSHLTGLFYRTANFVDFGIKPVYIFDGKSPIQKADTQKERRATRTKAEEKWKEAKESGDLAAARKYAQASSKLTGNMIEECKSLLDAMGIPWIQAPGEGEAQASWMCSKGDVWAVGSQDYDSLVYGTPRLLKNMAVSGKRKLPGREQYVEVTPEIIELDSMLKDNEIDKNQLVLISLLIGNDYEPGIKGIGPKKALGLVKKYPSLDKLRDSEEVGKDLVEIGHLDEIQDLFVNPSVKKDYELVWEEPNADEIKKILCDEYEFSEERIGNSLKKLEHAIKAGTQSKLESFF